MQLLNRAEQFPELQGLLLIAGLLDLGQAAHHLLELIAGALQLGATAAGQLQPLLHQQIQQGLDRAQLLHDVLHQSS